MTVMIRCPNSFGHIVSTVITRESTRKHVQIHIHRLIQTHTPELGVRVHAAEPFIRKQCSLNTIRKFSPLQTFVTLHPALIGSLPESPHKHTALLCSNSHSHKPHLVTILVQQLGNRRSTKHVCRNDSVKHPHASHKRCIVCSIIYIFLAAKCSQKVTKSGKIAV